MRGGVARVDGEADSVHEPRGEYVRVVDWPLHVPGDVRAVTGYGGVEAQPFAGAVHDLQLALPQAIPQSTCQACAANITAVRLSSRLPKQDCFKLCSQLKLC